MGKSTSLWVLNSLIENLFYLVKHIHLYIDLHFASGIP
jgi:hypothetical protein